ncbi:MAG: GNAT family N-acetyltransferase [Candidatus Pacebacteria bacterium]|nr:GNAT family N-acetyltransferase [Candidatus Paceibacterota bacterium]
MKAQLVLPSDKYKDSFLSAVREYQAENLFNYRHLNIKELENNFEKYVEDINNEAKGIGLPEGYVPHTVYWLVDDGGYIGRLDIRHELNEFLDKFGGHIGYDIRPTRRRLGFGKLILKLALEKAKELGIKEAVITCDLDNEGSRKIIEANGGQFIEITTNPSGIEKRRYIINLQ